MNTQLDVLFLGRLFPLNNGSAIRRKARVDMQDAANVLQWNLIKGLLSNGVRNVQIISYLPIDSWPKHYKDPFVLGTTEQYDDGSACQVVGFCNITGIKQLLSARACNRATCNWALQKNGREKVIVCYSENNVLMRAVAAAKKVNPEIKAIQVIADITEFAANRDANWAQQRFTEAQIKANKKNRQFVDGFVLLTKQMQRKLEITKPCMVMEGIVPFCETESERSVCSEKTILYTGSMNAKYGILSLLEAFACITDPNMRLLLCGLGNAETVIQQYCDRDTRICFMGKISHKDVLALQKSATVLVNPRQNNEEFTKYSFPSKTMEYLASGVPVVAYKLDGIPDEYDEYLNYAEDNSPESLANKLMEICNMDESARKEMGKRGADFVLKNKNAQVQTRRILDFLSERI